MLNPLMYNTTATTGMIAGQGGVDVIDPEASLDLFKDLPVIVVKDYNFSLKQLQAWRSEVEVNVSLGVYKWEKLFTQYWMEKVGNASRSSD